MLVFTTKSLLTRFGGFSKTMKELASIRTMMFGFIRALILFSGFEWQFSGENREKYLPGVFLLKKYGNYPSSLRNGIAFPIWVQILG